MPSSRPSTRARSMKRTAAGQPVAASPPPACKRGSTSGRWSRRRLSPRLPRSRSRASRSLLFPVEAVTPTWCLPIGDQPGTNAHAGEGDRTGRRRSPWSVAAGGRTPALVAKRAASPRSGPRLARAGGWIRARTTSGRGEECDRGRPSNAKISEAGATDAARR